MIAFLFLVDSSASLTSLPILASNSIVQAALECPLGEVLVLKIFRSTVLSTRRWTSSRDCERKPVHPRMTDMDSVEMQYSLCQASRRNLSKTAGRELLELKARCQASAQSPATSLNSIRATGIALSIRVSARKLAPLQKTAVQFPTNLASLATRLKRHGPAMPECPQGIWVSPTFHAAPSASIALHLASQATGRILERQQMAATQAGRVCSSIQVQ